MKDIITNPGFIIAIVLAIILAITVIRHLRDRKKATNVSTTKTPNTTTSDPSSGQAHAPESPPLPSLYQSPRHHSSVYTPEPTAPPSSIHPEAAALLSASVIEMEQNLNVLESLTKMQEIAGLKSGFPPT